MQGVMVAVYQCELSSLHGAKVERRLGKEITASTASWRRGEHCTHDLTEAGVDAEALMRRGQPKSRHG